MDRKKIEQLRDDNGLVLVEIYASWCPHCQRMMPVVEDIKMLLDGQANVYQFDIDENQELADNLDVQSIPTFIVFNGGEEVWRGSGEMEGSALLAHIRDAAAS